MAKHLVDLDEDALSSARARLATTTIKDTVNEALRAVGQQRVPEVARALDGLAEVPLEDREAAWR
jgi:Arc/MetJ family transcription regulator